MIIFSSNGDNKKSASGNYKYLNISKKKGIVDEIKNIFHNL